MNAQIISLNTEHLSSYEESFGNQDLFEGNNENYKDVENYRVYTGSDPGYAEIAPGAEFPVLKHLSNFYIEFSKWVRTVVDEMPVSYYNGKIITADSETEFTKMPASAMEDASSFKKYIANLCGPKALIFGNPSEVVKAIKTFNKNVPFFEAQEFGYDDELSCYYTEEFTITANGFLDQKTPIKYKENLGNNKLGFRTANVQDVKLSEISFLKNY